MRSPAPPPLRPKRQTVTEPAIRLRGVGRRFGALQAVRDVSMDVMPGERRAVLGPNGAGKTTLFNAICGDFPPTSGSIALFGADITRLKPHQRTRLGIGRTYQTSLLFNGLTVGENLFVAVRGLLPEPLLLPPPRPQRRGDGQGARARGAHAPVPPPGSRGAEPQPRPAPPARGRHGAGRRPARAHAGRAGGGPLAGRPAGTAEAAPRAAARADPGADRARHGRRPARRRHRHGDEGRRGGGGGRARPDRGRPGGAVHLPRGGGR